MRDYTQEVHDLYNTIDCFGPDTIQYNEARNRLYKIATLVYYYKYDIGADSFSKF